MISFKLNQKPDQKLQDLIVVFWNNKIWHSHN